MNNFRVARKSIKVEEIGKKRRVGEEDPLRVVKVQIPYVVLIDR